MNVVGVYLKRNKLSKRKTKIVIMASISLLLVVSLLYMGVVPAVISTPQNHQQKVHSLLSKHPNDDQESWRSWNFLQSLSRKFQPAMGDFTPSPSVDCQSKPQSDLPFCRTSLSAMERAIDLVSRLTIKEIIQQTSTIAPAISRFGIKDYNWRSNCLHGWSESGGHFSSELKWTVFPAPIGLGATFNTDLIQKVGQVTADEGRALHNEMLVLFKGSSTEAAGLNCFSPNVNLFRDPRWGRGMETFGEDPYLISLIGNAYTHGLQEGEDPKYLKVAACAKHFAVHSGPEQIRLHFRANTTMHDLYDTYLPAFKSQVVGAKVAQMMPAYSGMRCQDQMDGAPDAANPFLLKKVLREEFGAPNISIVSDNGAVVAVTSEHHYTEDNVHGAAVCMNATTDLDLGHDDVYPDFLGTALDKKLVKLETLQQAVIRNFFLRILLGDFDPPSMVPYQYINKSHLDTHINQQLNLETARQSIVLLKNVMGSLPLNTDALRHVAVIGPNANATTTLLSNYQGVPSQVVSVLQGIENAVKDKNVAVDFAVGCDHVSCEDTSKFDDALKIAQQADYVIAVMGLDGSMEREGHDRVETKCEGEVIDILALPGCQEELLDRLSAVHHRIVLVLINGGPVTVSSMYVNKALVGVLEAFYPGALGGTAVADILFGNYNPGGRMPVTVYESEKELPPAEDYGMSRDNGRTYRYYTGEPLIPFGYGLSYTEFSYSKLVVSPASIKICDSVKVSVSVQNTGDVNGDEVIQVYLKPPTISRKTFPNVELVGFERASITAKAIHLASFDINPYLLSLVDDDGVRYIFPGVYTVMVEELTKTFNITGSAPVKVSMCTSAPKCMAC